MAAGLGLATIAARAADPDALWKIVHNRCVPNAQSGGPAPCVQLGVDGAVLKDINGATQYLLIPTAPVSGIESPAVLAPGAPNWFAAAWAARRFTEAAAGGPLPRDDIALAINPPSARSQNQLHIHIDCIRADVRDALRRTPIPMAWTKLPEPLAGQRYSAIRLDGLELTANPFKLLSDGLPGPMAEYTLVLAGLPDGFALLAGRVGEDGRGHGEDVQDHGCAVAKHR